MCVLHCVTVGRANWFNLILLIWFLELKIISSLFYLVHLILSTTFKLNLASICPWSWWVTGSWLTRRVTLWRMWSSWPVMPVSVCRSESRQHHWVWLQSHRRLHRSWVSTAALIMRQLQICLCWRGAAQTSLDSASQTDLFWPNPDCCAELQCHYWSLVWLVPYLCSSGISIGLYIILTVTVVQTENCFFNLIFLTN